MACFRGDSEGQEGANSLRVIMGRAGKRAGFVKRSRSRCKSGFWKNCIRWIVLNSGDTVRLLGGNHA